MRILMLAQFYAPIIGGEERLVQDLSRELVRRGHEVSVVTLSQSGLPDFEIDQGVRIHRIRATTQRLRRLSSDAERSHIPPFPDPEATYAIRNIILRERPQIVHAHNWLVHSFVPLKKWSGAQLVMTLHDYSLSCPKKRLMYRGKPCSGPAFPKCLSCSAEHYGMAKGPAIAAANWWMGKAEQALVDLFLPISTAVLQGNGLGNGHARARVIPNFIPDDLGDRREPDEPCLAQLPADGYLLFVGDISEDKGIHVLLQAYRSLVSPPPLVLIGRVISDRPIELPRGAQLLGMWQHEAVMEAWHRCSIALTPSVWAEPFGLVAMEAMAAGRPVIASRTGGLIDLVQDGVNGYLVPPGDADALRLAIEGLLGDPQLRQRMGLAARQRSIEFQAGSVVPRIEQAYQDLLERAPRQKPDIIPMDKNGLLQP